MENEHKDHYIIMKDWVFRLILIVIICGIVVPFLAQVILPRFFPSVPVEGIDIWNQATNMVVGIVATVLSLVSLYMSFKNNDSTTLIHTKITSSLELLRSTELGVQHIRNSIPLLGLNVEQQRAKPKQTWENEPTDDSV